MTSKRRDESDGLAVIDQTSVHVRRAVDGDSIALSWLFERFGPLLVAQARYHLGALASRIDCADIVQDVWLRTIPRLVDLIPRNGRMTPVLMRFLSQTNRHTCFQILERELGAPNEPASSMADARMATGLDEILRSEVACSIRDAFAALSHDDHKIQVLVAIEQLTLDEAARVLGITKEAAKKRYGRSMRRLRELIPKAVLNDIV